MSNIRRQIMPGDLVVHEYDRPHANCIRLCASIHLGGAVTYYLTVGHNPGLNGALVADLELLSRVELFGIAPRWDVGNQHLVLEPTGKPSLATYRDGAHRQWQAGLPQTLTSTSLKTRIVDRWLSICAQRSEAA